MKTISVAVAFAYLAGFAAAAPVEPRGFLDGIFGGSNGEDGNFVSGVFDGAACIVSSVIGGGNPRCRGKGTDTIQVPVGNPENGGAKKNNRYSFNYDTNRDGSLKVTITLDRGGSCTYNLKADGKDVESAIKEAAKKCLAEKN